MFAVWSNQVAVIQSCPGSNQAEGVKSHWCKVVKTTGFTSIASNLCWFESCQVLRFIHVRSPFIWTLHYMWSCPSICWDWWGLVLARICGPVLALTVTDVALSCSFCIEPGKLQMQNNCQPVYYVVFLKDIPEKL
jgi:hypothetical protein